MTLTRPMILSTLRLVFDAPELVTSLAAFDRRGLGRSVADPRSRDSGGR